MRTRFGIVQAAVAVVILAFLGGCTANSFKGNNLGLRPDPPLFERGEDACKRYEEVHNKTLHLREAYHSRASQNRWWVYVAGALALGTAAATGGLGAVGAAGTSIALLSISGGATSGFFAVLDNQDLAAIYTDSANKMTTGLQVAEAEITYQGDEPEPASCVKALRKLEESVATAETELETARSSRAALAAARAKQEVDNLTQQIQQAEKASLAKSLVGATITDVQWDPQDKNAANVVVSTELRAFTMQDIQVKVAGTPVSVSGIHSANGTSTLSFIPPKEEGQGTDRSISVVFERAGTELKTDKPLKPKKP